MSFVPASRHPFPPITITPFADEGCGFQLAGSGGVSGTFITWPTANKALFWPLRLLEPVTVQKLFWANGVNGLGTNAIDMGVYRMTDLATGRLDLIRSIGSVTQLTTANVLQASSTWKVACNTAALTSGNDSTDRSSAPGYTTASVTLKAGNLYLLSFVNTAASAAVASAITGGPTWTSRSSTQFNGTAHRTSIWSGVPTTDYTGTIDIAFGATQTGCTWALNEFDGVDTATTDGVVQQAVGTGNSVTPLATLAAFGSANNATFGALGNVSDTTTTPGTGFTELSDTNAATPTSCLQTEWRVDNDTTVDGTITSGQWGACAVEIKADASAFTIPSDPVHCYVGMTMNGTVSEIFAAASSTHNFASAGMLELTSTFPLPSSLTPVATTGNFVPLAGISLRTLLD